MISSVGAELKDGEMSRYSSPELHPNTEADDRRNLYEHCIEAQWSSAVSHIIRPKTPSQDKEYWKAQHPVGNMLTFS